jgi:hypothetical protein
LACDAQFQFALSSLLVGQDLIHPRIQRSSTVGRIAVARSIDNDDDARCLAQRLHRSFGSSIDVNPRFLAAQDALFRQLIGSIFSGKIHFSRHPGHSGHHDLHRSVKNIRLNAATDWRPACSPADPNTLAITQNVA